MIKHDKPIALITADIASAVNSVLRIISTLIIYIFHCNAQFDAGSNKHLFYAFSFFLFISGYYSFFENKTPNEWIITRLKRIYIPYWIVIFGVIVANFFFDYKEIGARELFFALIGGNLFIEHKLYVIAWFISVIICFYICVYIYKKLTNILLKLIICTSIIILLLKFDIPYNFFLSFLLGYIIRAYIFHSSLEHKKIFTNINLINLFYFVFRPILLIQNYSYEFFLVHGGVILFFTQVLHLSYTTSMYGGIIFSLCCAVMLKIVSKKIDLIFLKNVGVSRSTLKIPS